MRFLGIELPPSPFVEVRSMGGLRDAMRDPSVHAAAFPLPHSGDTLFWNWTAWSYRKVELVEKIFFAVFRYRKLCAESGTPAVPPDGKEVCALLRMGIQTYDTRFASSNLRLLEKMFRSISERVGRTCDAFPDCDVTPKGSTEGIEPGVEYDMHTDSGDKWVGVETLTNGKSTVYERLHWPGLHRFRRHSFTVHRPEIPHSRPKERRRIGLAYYIKPAPALQRP